MKKSITIYQDNNTIEFVDNVEKKGRDYLQEYLPLFSSDKVSIIETSFGEFILFRPSKVSAIKISDIKEDT